MRGYVYFKTQSHQNYLTTKVLYGNRCPDTFGRVVFFDANLRSCSITNYTPLHKMKRFVCKECYMNHMTSDLSFLSPASAQESSLF